MSKYTPYLIILSLVLFAFSPILVSFFQQDEWLAFGYHYLVEKQGTEIFFKNALIPRLGHYSPLNYATEFFLFLLFRLNFTAWSITSITMHALNSFLVYKIGFKIFKKGHLALASAALFAVSLSSIQATSWPVANIGTHGATFFALCSFLFWLNDSKKASLISVSVLGISLMFKENAIAFFLLLPLWSLINNQKNNKKRYLVTLAVLFVSVRAIALVLPQSIIKGTIYDQPKSVENSFDVKKTIYNIATFPVKGISQSIVPPNTIVKISHQIANKIPSNLSGEPQTTRRDIFVLKYLVEAVNVVIFISLALLVLKSGKKGNYFFVFILLNSIVYALSPERVGKITIIDSRNLYLLTAGSSLLLVSLFKKYPNKLFYGLIIGIISLNCIFTFKENKNIVGSNNIRRRILTQIKIENKNLPDKVVFYTQSDTSYFGLPDSEKILPFQSGLGQTLLVWYYGEENFPDEFLKQKYLWEIKDEGYMEVDGRGFGYFRNLSNLLENMEKYEIQPSSVIVYNWDSKNMVLTKSNLNNINIK